MKHGMVIAATWGIVSAFTGLAWAEDAAASHPAPAAVLLERGIYNEETVGDLDAAIKAYRQIVDDAKANRPYAAQAQYRLAMCYLKKGDKAQAAQELREVLAAYPQEKDLAGRAQAELSKLAPAVETAPRVLKTSPVALANDVDPSLDKITVTFDRPMMDKSWSFGGYGDRLPVLAGEISWDATSTTCTMPVKLQPGKVHWVGVEPSLYSLGIGNPSFEKPSDGLFTKRYIILFATRSADGKPTPLPEDLVKQTQEINAAATKKT